MWTGVGGGQVNGQVPQKPVVSVQADNLFTEIYQEVRCAAPSAQVIKNIVEICFILGFVSRKEFTQTLMYSLIFTFNFSCLTP